MIHLDDEALDDATTAIVKASRVTWDDVRILAQKSVQAYQDNLAMRLMSREIKQVIIETEEPPTRN